jgi:recombination protein RecA
MPRSQARTKKTTKRKRVKQSNVKNVWSAETLTLLKKIRKKFGEDAILRGSEVAQTHKVRIPTGIFALDAAVGGGIPKGRITLITGGFSATKTSLCLKIAAEAQKRCRYCMGIFRYEVMSDEGKIKILRPCRCGESIPNMVIFADVEGTVDFYDYAPKLGFDPRIALVTQPDYAEQGIDVVDALVRSGEADLVIVDSIAALVPTTEIEKSAESWQQGLGARLINKFCRKLSSGLNSLGARNMQKPAVVFINQERMTIGIMYGDPTVIPFGRGQTFTASLWVILKTGKPIRMDERGRRLEKQGEVVGQSINWRVKKNKVSPGQGRTGSYDFITLTSKKLRIKTGDVDNREQILGYAKVLGVVEVTGGAHYTYQDIKGHGERKFIYALRKARLWNQFKREVTRLIQAQNLAYGGSEEE